MQKDKDKFIDLDKICPKCKYEWTLVYSIGEGSALFRDSCPNCGEIL